jgi:hypothetical protein
MNMHVRSVMILTIYFCEHPEWFSRLWVADNCRTLDDVSGSAELWEGIFEATFATTSTGIDDPRWDELFLEYRMMEALRECAKVTSL